VNLEAGIPCSVALTGLVKNRGNRYIFRSNKEKEKICLYEVNANMSIHITANGKPRELPGELSVSQLLTEVQVEMPDYVSVQINDEMILRADFDKTLVKEGAVVEFLYFMGGGSPW
jgi:sulfur carrier protein